MASTPSSGSEAVADEQVVKDHKDFWDKLHIVLSPLGGLLTALAVASLGLLGSRALERQQSSEAKLRLYSELMTRREESEATLRKEMFQSIIGSFFDAGTASSWCSTMRPTAPRSTSTVARRSTSCRAMAASS